MVALAKSDPFLSRLKHTAKQKGVLVFVFNRAGYIAAKDEVDARRVTIFGVRFLICDEQPQRALAFWDVTSLRRHLAQFQ